MLKKNLAPALFCIACLAGAIPSRADDATEARLRDALRSTTAQLSASQDQLAQLQAKLAVLQQQVAVLQQKPAASSQARVNAAEVARAEADFNRKLGAQTDTIAKLQSAYSAASDAAKAADAARANLASQLDDTKKQHSLDAAKNQKLFDLANEILDRFAHENMGDVMVAREPFLQFKRVELENLMQDYQDKFHEQRIKP